jgi:hypothetical protein
MPSSKHCSATCHVNWTSQSLSLSRVRRCYANLHRWRYGCEASGLNGQVTRVVPIVFFLYYWCILLYILYLPTSTAVPLRIQTWKAGGRGGAFRFRDNSQVPGKVGTRKLFRCLGQMFGWQKQNAAASARVSGSRNSHPIKFGDFLPSVHTQP